MCSPVWETDGGGWILERGGRRGSSEAARVFTMGDAPEVNSGSVFWMRLGVADLLVVTDCSDSAGGQRIGRRPAEEHDGGRLGFATGGGAPAILRRPEGELRTRLGGAKLVATFACSGGRQNRRTVNCRRNKDAAAGTASDGALRRRGEVRRGEKGEAGALARLS
jgi:hypothetical protein